MNLLLACIWGGLTVVTYYFIPIGFNQIPRSEPTTRFVFVFIRIFYLFLLQFVVTDIVLIIYFNGCYFFFSTKLSRDYRMITTIVRKIYFSKIQNTKAKKNWKIDYRDIFDENTETVRIKRLNAVQTRVHILHRFRISLLFIFFFIYMHITRTKTKNGFSVYHYIFITIQVPKMLSLSNILSDSKQGFRFFLNK